MQLQLGIDLDKSTSQSKQEMEAEKAKQQQITAREYNEEVAARFEFYSDDPEKVYAKVGGNKAKFNKAWARARTAATERKLKQLFQSEEFEETARTMSNKYSGPSYQQLAKRFNITNSAAIRGIQHLEENNWYLSTNLTGFRKTETHCN